MSVRDTFSLCRPILPELGALSSPRAFLMSHESRASGCREKHSNAARELLLFNNGRPFRHDLGWSLGTPSGVPAVINRGMDRPLERQLAPPSSPLGAARHGTATSDGQKLALLGGDRGATETNVARRGEAQLWRPSHPGAFHFCATAGVGGKDSGS